MRWMPVVGYEGLYEVSETGEVRGIDRVVKRGTNQRFVSGQLLKKRKAPNGYESVSLRNQGGQKRLYVHRLVASAFLENKGKLREVNHKDEDKSNNAVENLEWCSHSYNMKYAGGSKRRVEKRMKRVVLVNDDGSVNEFESICDAARSLGVSPANISRCCHHVKNQTRVSGRVVMFGKEYESLFKGGDAR